MRVVRPVRVLNKKWIGGAIFRLLRIEINRLCVSCGVLRTLTTFCSRLRIPFATPAASIPYLTVTIIFQLGISGVIRVDDTPVQWYPWDEYG